MVHEDTGYIKVLPLSGRTAGKLKDAYAIAYEYFTYSAEICESFTHFIIHSWQLKQDETYCIQLFVDKTPAAQHLNSSPGYTDLGTL